MLQLKEKLYQFCLDHIESRMLAAQNAISDAQDSSKNETKSSAGDKYETGRAMAQQEIDRNQAQLIEAAKLKQALERINPAKTLWTIQPGTLAFTNNGNFYLAISAGQVKIDEDVFFAVSPASPIGLKLSGLKKGDEMSFNDKVYKVEKVI